tara:strand:+ start:127 stop:609 length:483 start_codon:yes stop_codon:yes gene_type:complete
MDVRSYNKIVDQQADGLFRFAYSMCKDRDDAKDIVQEAFSALWEKKDQVNPSKVKSYLFTTAHHKVIDMFRKSKRFQKMEEVPTHLTTHQHNHDLKAILDEALNTLSEAQKSVILLRDYEGYNYEEIADIIGLNLSQVKVYIFRGRQKLKNYIGKMDVVI